MILDYVKAKIEAEVNAKLATMGLDPNRSDFSSPEEQQAYQQEVQTQTQALTPPEIQKYMDMTWMHIAEIWGQHQLELDKERFHLAEKEKVEFEDMLTADRCFRHYYLTGNGYDQETWNTINTFFHRSPEIPYVEEGDYVGRCFYLTTSALIDRCGFLMKESDLNKLQGEVKKDSSKKWGEAAGTEFVYSEYAEPFKGAKEYKLMETALGFKNVENSGIPYIDEGTINKLSNGSIYSAGKGFHLLTEAYWKSQKKIGKVTYIDPSTGVLTKMLIDENVIIPKEFKQLDSTFEDTNEPNTVVWTWVNQIWKGKKISKRGIKKDENDDIYFDIKPLEFQFKGDVNPYKAKLPVCGQVFSIRNSQSMSLVDSMKPDQIGHNVAMNQLYQIMEREIGKFIVMDVNLFPNMKDWGGEKGWEKFMLVAKQLGLAPADTSPQNTKGANNGGQLPKEFDLDETARMASRMKIAEFFEQRALKQVGFNDYRLGQQASSSTAEGVKTGRQASTAQTESYFTNFSNYKRRCLKMNLDIAQYVQAKEKDITISYTKSDMSRAFTKLNGTDLTLADLHVYVSDSQEQIRQLEMMRKIALENNTTGATTLDLMDIVTINSPAEIKLQIEQSLKKQEAAQNREYELRQQELQQQSELAQLAEAKKDERQDKELEAKKEIAYITTFSRQDNNQVDQEGQSGVPDVLEYDKLNAKTQAESQKVLTQQEKNRISRDKLISDKELGLKKLQLEKEKLKSKERIEDKNLQIVKANRGQNPKSKK